MLIFLLVVSGLLLVEFCVAPVVVPANPGAAPEVSVVVYNNPEWVPPVYTTNPFTGEVKVSSQGFWRASGTIEITIKNRPFTSYTDKNGNYIDVYYSFFLKTTSLVLWDNISRPSYAVYQSDSSYTVVTFRYGGKITSDPENLWSIHDPGQLVYFRVQAVTGYFNRYSDVFEGEGSEWTEFTVTIPTSDKPSTSSPSTHLPSKPSNPPSVSNTDSSSPQGPLQPNVTNLVVFVCVVVVLLVVIVYLFYSRQRKSGSLVVEEVGYEVKNE